MTDWKERLKDDPVPWLLEADAAQPAIRYFTLRDIAGRNSDDEELRQAGEAVMASGPVPKILAAQHPEGYWVKPGPGYGPKYMGTVWQVTFLAQLGANGADPGVHAAAEYVLNNSVAPNGGFSVNKTASAFIHCLAGNLGAALLDLGWQDDERLQKALQWQARTITGEGVADTDTKDTTERYYKSGTCGPDFACAANKGPCAWGAVKAMLALSKLSPSQRTPLVEVAIEHGVGFLLSRNPVVADYHMGWAEKPNRSWFKFGYPIAYVTDILQNLEVLAALGFASDSRLAEALELVQSKQDTRGRWQMEYGYNGKTWVDIEKKGQPSKWITLRALRVLKAAYPE